MEIIINSPLERLWHYSQTPHLHEAWDLRFTSIRFLPEKKGQAEQRFTYTTRIGLGLAISGIGETIASTTGKSGNRTSSLKFWSGHPLSLIEQGAGYWKYETKNNATIFSTWYDYRVRFGILGRAFDKIIFRPILGWATALSFDCLRIWLEDDIHPRQTLYNAILQRLRQIAYCLLFISFIYNPTPLTPGLFAGLLLLNLRKSNRPIPTASNCTRQRKQ